ncbi:MAG: hypothetical protein ACF8Q5_04885 [Phycisphaerales bacterium JB040]
MILAMPVSVIPMLGLVPLVPAYFFLWDLRRDIKADRATPTAIRRGRIAVVLFCVAVTLNILWGLVLFGIPGFA